MQIQPAPTKLLCRICDLTDTSELRIVVPENVNKLLPYGEVLAVGTDCSRTAVGDKVLFTPAAMTILPHNGEDLAIIDEGSVFAKYVE